MTKLLNKQVYNPMIFEKTKDGEFIYDVFSRLIKERALFLEGEITGELATTVSATLMWLDNQRQKVGGNKEISIYINSPGGTITDGLFTIYDTMKFIKSPIKTVCIGEACSAAAVLLSSGDRGRRFAFENADIMIHEVQFYGEFEGSTSLISKEARRMVGLTDRLLRIMCANTGQPIEKLKEDFEKERYFTAQEALDYGLIDEIIKPHKKTPTEPVKRARKKTN